MQILSNILYEKPNFAKFPKYCSNCFVPGKRGSNCLINVLNFKYIWIILRLSNFAASATTVHCKSVPAQSQIWHTMWQSSLKWRKISPMWSIFCFTCVKYASWCFWHMVSQIRLKRSQQRIIVKHILYTTCVKCEFVPVPDLQCTTVNEGNLDKRWNYFSSEFTVHLQYMFWVGTIFNDLFLC
jgi:hypothetical protein